MRKLAQTILVLALVLVVISLPQLAQAESTAHAPDFSTASELISAVNALRADHGLPPYQVNSILMGIAQSQAEYLVSIGTYSHADANGLLPYQRALAAGYLVAGDLSQRGFFSENLTGGIGQTAEEAVENWMGDAAHQNTMLSPILQDVGAGVGQYGNTFYYVLDCGLSTGGTPVAYTPPPPLIQYTPTIVANTPNADGSIIHIVSPDETTIGIAMAYGILWTDLLNLNGLNEKSIIYVGQEIIIRPANTPTPTQPTSTPTVRPTITPWPTSTPTLPATPVPPTATPLPALSVSAAGGTLSIIVVAALVVAGLVTLLGHKQKQ
jgi:uncharacterized protein YkwD/LysM repeat protein